MNKTELVQWIAKEAGISLTDARKAVEAIEKEIATALQRGEEVTISRFGRFSTIHRSARMGRNPKTGGVIEIQPTNVPTFKAARALKVIVDDDGHG